MKTHYINTSKTERWQFTLRGNLATVKLQRQVAGNWANVAEAPTYTRQFEQDPHPSHYSKFREKFAKDADYRRQFEQARPTQAGSELDAFFEQDLKAEAGHKAAGWLAGHREAGKPEAGEAGKPEEINQPIIEERKEITMEQPFFSAIKMYDPDGVDTFYHIVAPTLKELDQRVETYKKVLKARGYTARPSAPPAVATPAAPLPNGTPPAYQPGRVDSPFAPGDTPPGPWAQGQPPAPAGASFPAELLTVDVVNGKLSFKIKGGRKFQKFGVRVFDEILAEAGIDSAAIQPGTYSLAGWTAYYCVKTDNGNADKITRLVKA